MQSNNKIGFWTLTSLVIGSQIGSGIFLLPASLSVFGAIGLTSWFITATGAILLATVFAKLSARIPKTGGPHTFIQTAFNPTLGFFSAWTYWTISWLSTPMVLISVVGYLTPLFGNTDPIINLMLEILILLSITALNLSGVKSAGLIEFFLTVLKLLPLIIVPCAGLFFMHPEHFTPFNPTPHSTLHVLNAAALLTLWGFIGMESATTPAESVINPKKTIPKAIIIGTLVVAIVYVFCNFVIMGVVPPDILAHSKAPFADAAQRIFGGSWYLIISVAASVVCLGTLNAWILTSGQIALGAAYDGHLPKLFTIKNKQGAPKWAITISSLGIIPILIVTLQQDLIAQVNQLIDVSVTAFLFIYVLSVLSFLRLFWRDPVTHKIDETSILIGIGALLFCGWALFSSGISMVFMALTITLAGVPIYWWKKKARSRFKYFLLEK